MRAFTLRMRGFALVLGALLMGFAVPAAAQSPGGQLKCDVAGGVSFIFGSSRALDCVFTPNEGPVEHYKGTINKYGIDIGYQKRGTLLWAVWSPAHYDKPGSLQGKYVGGTAQLAAGPGVSGNVLVSGNKIELNPLSGGGARGINIAAGVAGLELVYVRGGY